MRSPNSKFIVMAMLSVLSNGCAHSVSPHCAPVSQNYSDMATGEPDYYRVKKDDTLYSISQLFALDYRQLAEWNGVRPPFYTIEIGQKIRLSDPVLENKLMQNESLLPRMKATEQLPGTSTSNVLDNVGLFAKSGQKTVGWQSIGMVYRAGRLCLEAGI